MLKFYVVHRINEIKLGLHLNKVVYLQSQ